MRNDVEVFFRDKFPDMELSLVLGHLDVRSLAVSWMVCKSWREHASYLSIQPHFLTALSVRNAHVGNDSCHLTDGVPNSSCLLPMLAAKLQIFLLGITIHVVGEKGHAFVPNQSHFSITFAVLSPLSLFSFCICRRMSCMYQEVAFCANTCLIPVTCTSFRRVPLMILVQG